MSFSKSYPVPGLQDEEIMVTWERGYSNVKLYFRGKLLHSIDTAIEIKQGVSIESEELGNVHISFNDQPIFIQIRVNGVLCPVNREQANKELEGAASIFWVLFVLAVIGTLIEGFQLGFGNSIGQITTVINILFTSVYAIAAIYSKKGQPWAYYMGFFVFLGMTVLVGGLNILVGNLFIIIQLVIRGIILYALFGYFKNARDLSRLINKEASSQNDLLDS